MKSKSSKERETVAPHIVRNPGDTSVVRGERVLLEYVWVNGRLEKKVKKGKEKQGKAKALKCKLVPGGVRKVKAMEKKLKAISKDLKRFSRILGQFSSPGGER